MLRGMYDLVFGYEDGDPARPRFSAGLGLQLATKMLLGYSGAPFWKMQAGMGEVIFAPLYEVLRDRGVEFRFFHRVDALRLAHDGRSIAAVELGLQAELADGVDAYDPLIPGEGPPLLARRAARARSCGTTDVLEGSTSSRSGLLAATSAAAPSRRAKDFDAVVFAISLGMVPHVCGELLAASPAWRVDGRSMWGRSPRRRSSSGCPRTSRRSDGPALRRRHGQRFRRRPSTPGRPCHISLPAEDWPETEHAPDDRLLLQRPRPT